MCTGGAINEHDKEPPALREACQTELAKTRLVIGSLVVLAGNKVIALTTQQ
jgi:hypothetical protein